MIGLARTSPTNQSPPPILNNCTQICKDFSTDDFDDVQSEITFKLICFYFDGEIKRLLELEEHNRLISMRSSVLNKFYDNMHANHVNVFYDRSDIIKQMYIFHHMCKGLYDYNEKVLKMSYRNFRSRILFPNMIYFLYRLLPKAHKFLNACFNGIFGEMKAKNYGIIQRHVESYYMDEDIIKNNIMMQFIGDGLRKFDPLDIENPNVFYKQVFRNLLYYYFKGEEKAHTSYSSLWDIDVEISNLMPTTTRLAIYRDVMYELQVEKYCTESFALKQINYNFNVFKNVIIPNELQSMYYGSKYDSYMLVNDQYRLLKLYGDDKEKSNTDILFKIKQETPIIYKLLKCVHIVNPKHKPYNDLIIKPELVKTAVLEELIKPFKNFFGEDHLMGILTKIADNFTNSILSGEYINLMSLTSIKINQMSFIEQVKIFIRMCIEESLFDE